MQGWESRPAINQSPRSSCSHQDSPHPWTPNPEAPVPRDALPSPDQCLENQLSGRLLVGFTLGRWLSSSRGCTNVAPKKAKCHCWETSVSILIYGIICHWERGKIKQQKISLWTKLLKIPNFTEKPSKSIKNNPQNIPSFHQCLTTCFPLWKDTSNCVCSSVCMFYFPLCSKWSLLCKIYPGQLIYQAENRTEGSPQRDFGSSGFAGSSCPKVSALWKLLNSTRMSPN